MPNQPSILPPENPQKKSLSGTEKNPGSARSRYRPLPACRSAAYSWTRKLDPADRVPGRRAFDCRCRPARSAPRRAPADRSARSRHFSHCAQGCAHAQSEPFRLHRRRGARAPAPLCPDGALHDRRSRDRRRYRAREHVVSRGAGPQRCRPVPADRDRVGDALRRTAHHRRKYRGPQPPGRLRRLLAAVPYHRRQADLA